MKPVQIKGFYAEFYGHEQHLTAYENYHLYVRKLLEEMNGTPTSICYWVRKQLHIPTTLIPIVNANGFQCLGYQSKLFAK